MKVPSVSVVLRNAAATYLRFPAAILVAVIGTIAAVILVTHAEDLTAQWLMGILYACSLALPLLITAVLVAERRGWSRGLLQVAGFLLAAGYWVTLPHDLSVAPFSFTYRHLILLAAAHFLVAAAPFAGEPESPAFWLYNKALFLRILVAALFSHVLWVGLSVALMALDHLFGVTISGDRYAQLWMLIAGVFNTWFFLGGVPVQPAPVEAEVDYPKGLRVFTQYVLLPLVAIYLIILYAYAGKILLTWTWPEGWVSKLILGFSITGILALLLIHPLRETEGYRWVRLSWKWYFIILLPLAGLLLLATYRRVAEYALTESRYVGVVLAFWLTGITLYFIFSRHKSIRVIPLSLCVIGLAIAWGPWGAFRISAQSQMNRLERLLTANGILVEGKVRRTTSTVPVKVAEDIQSIVYYMVSTHGTARLQPWFDIRLDTVAATGVSRWYRGNEQSARIVGLMGLQPTGVPRLPGRRDWGRQSRGVEIEGYLFMAPLGVAPVAYPVAGHGTLTVETIPDSFLIVVRENATNGERIAIDLRPLCERLRQRSLTAPGAEPSQEEMTVESAGTRLKAKVVLNHLRCPESFEKPDLSFIGGVVLIGDLQQ